MPTSAACSDGRVVDAVAQEADDVARGACSARMMRFFCAGETRANTRGLARPRAPSAASVMRSMSSPEHDRARVEPDLRADVPGDQLVVAGEDLHRDAVARGARASASAASSRGGSRKASEARRASGRARRPTRVAGLRRRPAGRRPPARRYPSRAQPLERAPSQRRPGVVVERRRPRRRPRRACSSGRTLSGAPLVISSRAVRRPPRRPTAGAARSRTGSRRPCGSAATRRVARAAGWRHPAGS